MARVVGFDALGIVSVIEDAAGGGVKTDPNAPRNAPAITPASYLDKVLFHIGFDYYRVFASGTTTINHASVAGVTGNRDAPPASVVSLGNMAIQVNGQTVVTTHTLYTHNLGYVPRFFVAFNSQMIPPGIPIQQDDLFRDRYVSAYATTSIIGLKDIGHSTDSALSAASRDYQFLVFETVAPNPALPLMSGGPGYVQMGRGMIDTTKRMLRVAVAGDSPFGIALGPTADYNNGGMRVYTPAGVAINTGGYGGSFGAPAAISVGA